MLVERVYVIEDLNEDLNKNEWMDHENKKIVNGENENGDNLNGLHFDDEIVHGHVVVSEHIVVVLKTFRWI